jgi:hypothetical protein
VNAVANDGTIDSAATDEDGEFTLALPGAKASAMPPSFGWSSTSSRHNLIVPSSAAVINRESEDIFSQFNDVIRALLVHVVALLLSLPPFAFELLDPQ